MKAHKQLESERLRVLREYFLSYLSCYIPWVSNPDADRHFSQGGRCWQVHSSSVSPMRAPRRFYDVGGGRVASDLWSRFLLTGRGHPPFILRV